MDWRAKTGRIVGGVELRIVDDAGNELPWDGEAVGEIEVRGPWITGDYYDDPAPEKFHDGWLRTGDVGSVDANGYVQITDRAKDVIKSGGEWISSVELENQLMAHPDVRRGERRSASPTRAGTSARSPASCARPVCATRAPTACAGSSATQVAKWQVPERWAFIDEVPKTERRQVRQEGAARPAREGRAESCETNVGRRTAQRGEPRRRTERVRTRSPRRRSCRAARRCRRARGAAGAPRSSKLAFHGGAWVFPGRSHRRRGLRTTATTCAAAARAAVREAKEEAGIDVDADTLVHLSNWTTPEISPKRFATWFFAGPCTPSRARRSPTAWNRCACAGSGPSRRSPAHAAGEIELAPPQYVTLLRARRFATVADALEAVARPTPIDFTPRFHFLDGGGAVCVYDGDVAFDDLDAPRRSRPAAPPAHAADPRLGLRANRLKRDRRPFPLACGPAGV